MTKWSRKGTGLLPPNPKQWDNEHRGLDLREALNIRTDCPLDPEAAFSLLTGVRVSPHGEIPAADEFLEHFRRGKARSAWSGFALRLAEEELVVYNDSHPDTRVRATLMEEFFHIFLNHPRSIIRVIGNGTAERTHNQLVEDEAYGSGAAALVPYKILRELLEDGKRPGQIATVFEVSADLVVFRAKVTRLYHLIKRGRRQ